MPSRPWSAPSSTCTRPGTDDLYIARVDAAVAGGEPMPLLYYSGRYLRIERASSHELEGKPEV